MPVILVRSSYSVYVTSTLPSTDIHWALVLFCVAVLHSFAVWFAALVQLYSAKICSYAQGMNLIKAQGKVRPVACCAVNVISSFPFLFVEPRFLPCHFTLLRPLACFPLCTVLLYTQPSVNLLWLLCGCAEQELESEPRRDRSYLEGRGLHRSENGMC